ncbi:MAG: DUF1761 domain-containing protein [Bacteroidota bacterium]
MDINWLSMLLASATPLVIGIIYYHPSVFGKAWGNSLGKSVEELAGGNKVVAAIVYLLTSFLLAFFLLNFNNDGINQEGDFDNFPHGAWHGLFVAVTIVIPIVIMSGLRERQSWKTRLINVFYWIITLAIMGGVVDAMNHWQNIPMPEGY